MLSINDPGGNMSRVQDRAGHMPELSERVICRNLRIAGDDLFYFYE